MTKRLRKFPFKTILYALFILVVYLLQTAVFSRLPIFGAKPVIFPLVVMAIAMFDGYVYGGWFGVFAGVLCDLSMNQPAIQFTLIFTFLGLAVGYLSDTVFARGFPSYLLWGVFSVVLTSFAQIFGFIVFGGVMVSRLLVPFIFQSIYSLIFLLPVYVVIRWLDRF